MIDYRGSLMLTLHSHVNVGTCVQLRSVLSLEKPNVLLNFSHKKLHQGFLAVLPWTLFLKTPALL